MQFFTVGVSGFLFIFLICLPDLEDAQTQGPTRRRYRKDEKGICVKNQPKTKFRAGTELFKDAGCLHPIVYRKRQLTNLKSARNETIGKSVDSKKSRRSLRQSSRNMREIERADDEVSSKSRNQRKSKRMSKSGRKSTRAVFAYDKKSKWCYRTDNRTIGFRSGTQRACLDLVRRSSRKRSTERSSSCEGQILHKTDDAGVCDLVNRTIGMAIAQNVLCLDHAECFMIDNLYCKSFQKGNWDITGFQHCDTDYRIMRTVERNFFQESNSKACPTWVKSNLGEFKGHQIFNSTGQCLKTHYIIDNDECTPKLEHQLTFYYKAYYAFKKVCEDVLARRRKATQPPITVRTPPPTVRTPPPTVRQPTSVRPATTPQPEQSSIAPSSSCEGQILNKTDDADVCHLINRMTAETVLNVPCLDHIECFMIDKQYCMGFRNRRWKMTGFQRCDMDNRITRAVERGISLRGNKRCEIQFGRSLKDFEGLQTFNSISQCVNTYYIPDYDGCTPKFKPDFSKYDAVYHHKKDCEDAIAERRKVTKPPPTIRTSPPTVRTTTTTTRQPEVVPATTPAIEEGIRTQPTRPPATREPERRRSTVKFYTYPKHCPIPHAPGKCVDTERYEKFVSEAQLVHLVDPAKTINFMHDVYNVMKHETIGSATRKLLVIPDMLYEVSEDNEKAVKMLMSGLPLLLNNDQCSALFHKAPFRQDFLRRSIIDCS